MNQLTHEIMQSVAISQCGTFAVIGSAGGSIDMFNMQSGSHRQRFPSRLSKSRDMKANAKSQTAARSLPIAFRTDEGKHTKAVTGLVINALNQTVISCGLDGRVKVRFEFFHLICSKLTS